MFRVLRLLCRVDLKARRIRSVFGEGPAYFPKPYLTPPSARKQALSALSKVDVSKDVYVPTKMGNACQPGGRCRELSRRQSGGFWPWLVGLWTSYRVPKPSSVVLGKQLRDWSARACGDHPWKGNIVSSSHLTATPAWQALTAEHAAIAQTNLRELFDTDPGRGERLTATAGDLFLDYSKNLVTDQTVAKLVELAKAAGLEKKIAAMFAGEHINITEDRAVLHTALRLPRDAKLVVDGQDVVADVHEVLDRAGDFAERVRSGAWTGHSGERITTVVNIGIGGSDLGPVMAYEALRDYADRAITAKFVSNIDPTDIFEKLHGLDLKSTLFIVASKTFGTAETLTNAKVAREQLLAAYDGDQAAVAKHFVAVSTNAQRVADFGIDTANMFGFWDWVGGRYSFDSAVGLALMISVGADNFREMLAGFHTMDEHFRSTPLMDNVPALMGLLNVWYNNFFGTGGRAVLPYSQYLVRFPAYLQQLTMESNGKSVHMDGSPVEIQTGEIFWGEPGTNGQHAFYQLLHQGTKVTPADFIGFSVPNHDIGTMHDLFMSNYFAQSAALAFGKTADEVRAEGTPEAIVNHKVMPGNRPSNSILADKLTPSVLGQLVALYEHITFTQAAIWDINAFDQWGVELGKAMALQFEPMLASVDTPNYSADASTNALIARYRAQRGRK